MHFGIITLRNYRCFGWGDPAVLEFSPGFAAYIGTNNSGKSTALRAVYELRNVWGMIFSSFAPSSNHRATVDPLGVKDVQELANNLDPTKIEIKIEISGIDKSLDSSAAAIKCLVVEYNTTNRVLMPKSVLACTYTGSVMSLDRTELLNGNAADGYRIAFGNFGWIDFSGMQKFMEELQRARFFPAFRNAINEGAGQYYDLPVGTSLVATWNQWKAGDSKKSKMAISAVEKEIANLLGFNSIQINADASGKSFDIYIDGHPHKLYEVGSGIAQLIITLASALVLEPSHILIDEPELSLHPALQLSFLSTLGAYCSGSVHFATHSYGLARSAANRISVIQRSGTSKMVHLNSPGANLSELLGELGYAARLELGCEGILLVEGPTDVLIFQEFLRKLGRDRAYVIMQLGGASMINPRMGPQLGEICRLTDSKNIHVFIDSEKKSESEPLSEAREKFGEICSNLGMRVVISTRRATENYFEGKGIAKALGDDFKPLGPYQLLREIDKPWDKANNWKIARATEISDIEETDLGRFLRSL